MIPDIRQLIKHKNYLYCTPSPLFLIGIGIGFGIGFGIGIGIEFGFGFDIDQFSLKNLHLAPIGLTAGGVS